MNNRENGDFNRQVKRKAKRKLKLREQKNGAVWFGLGMFGLIGWSIAVPTLVGTAIGLWLDSRWPLSHSWTLSFLVIGLIIGCLNAWYWVGAEGVDD